METVFWILAVATVVLIAIGLVLRRLFPPDR